MISGCDWVFASLSAGIVVIVCDDSFSHEGTAGSIYCVVVSAGQGVSVYVMLPSSAVHL